MSFPFPVSRFDSIFGAPTGGALEVDLSPQWIHQIRRDTGISVTDALELAGDRSFWRQIATAGSYG